MRAKRYISQLAQRSPLVRPALRAAFRRMGYDVRRYPHEATLEAHLRGVLDHYGISIVLDVGAHVGEYGALLRAIGYDRRIVSFEPVDETFDQLAARAATDPLWDAERVAFGRVAEVRTLNIARWTTFSSFLARTETSRRLFAELSETARTEVVPVVPLADRYWNLVDERDRTFLKIDTQGLDLEIVRGAGAAIDHVAAVQMELSFRALYERAPRFDEVLEEMQALGFEVSGMFPVRRDESLRLIEVDCILVRAASAA